MSAMKIVIDLLKASPTVTAQVASTQIRPVKATQGMSPPYILVNLVAEPGRETLEGATRFYQARVQVEVLAATATAAYDIGRLVKRTLDNVVKQTVGVHTSVDVRHEGTDYTDDSDDQTLFRRIMDFYVDWYDTL